MTRTEPTATIAYTSSAETDAARAERVPATCEWCGDETTATRGFLEMAADEDDCPVLCGDCNQHRDD